VLPLRLLRKKKKESARPAAEWRRKKQRMSKMSNIEAISALVLNTPVKNGGFVLAFVPMQEQNLPNLPLFVVIIIDYVSLSGV
jgi:hypothetical protein